MNVTLHFVTAASGGDAVATRLRDLGFTEVRVLPDGRRVVLAADADSVRLRLGIELQPTPRDPAVGPGRWPKRAAQAAEGARLPPELDALVERWYVPVPPDRLDRRSPS